MTNSIPMSIKDAVHFAISVIPELTFKFKESPEKCDATQLATTLKDFTHQTIRKKDWIRTEFSIRIVQYLLDRAEHTLKTAIYENYWFSFSKIKTECNPEEWSKIKDYIPKELQMQFQV